MIKREYMKSEKLKVNHNNLMGYTLVLIKA